MSIKVGRFIITKKAIEKGLILCPIDSNIEKQTVLLN